MQGFFSTFRRNQRCKSDSNLKPWKTWERHGGEERLPRSLNKVVAGDKLPPPEREIGFGSFEWADIVW